METEKCCEKCFFKDFENSLKARCLDKNCLCHQQKPQECENCDYDNAVRHRRADWRCPKCGRQLMLEMVLMKEAEDRTQPENSWMEKFDKEFDGEYGLDVRPIENRAIKEFISNLLATHSSKIRKEVMEEIVEGLPKEKTMSDFLDSDAKFSTEIKIHARMYRNVYNQALSDIKKSLTNKK